jgi:hypothetical protein
VIACRVATREPFSDSASQRCNATGRPIAKLDQIKNRQHPAFSRGRERSLPQGILKPFRVVSAAAHFRPRLKSWAFRHNLISRLPTQPDMRQTCQNRRE